MQKKNLIIIALVLIAIITALSLIGYFNQKKVNPSNISANITVNLADTKKTNSYSGPEITALDLLKKYNSVNTTSSTYGEFVNCINTLCSNNNYYWMYSVNGKLAQTGAGSYLVKNNDNLEFNYTKSQY